MLSIYLSQCLKITIKTNLFSICIKSLDTFLLIDNKIAMYIPREMSTVNVFALRPQGSYKMPNVGIEVDAAVFPPGDYHAKGSVVTGDSGEISVGCIEVYASFA